MNTQVVSNMEHIVYCGCCKVKRTPSQFIKNDKQMKSCNVCRQRSMDYNSSHKEERKIYAKQWAEANEERVKQNNKDYRSKNRDKIQQQQTARYALMKKLLAEHNNKIK